MKRHLLGVCGVGMSALATVLKEGGDDVSGSDRSVSSPNAAFLAAKGIRVFPDDGSGIDASVGEVIVSTAIEDANPGLVKARALGIPVVHRAVALSRALSGRRLVAVVGTCGKSTVTAMLGHILGACGFDPFCVNGAVVPGWDGAVRLGKGAYAVAEVDESDRSLVAFDPYAAIVTNASADHYSKEEMDAVFDAFAARCSGPVVDGRSGPGGEPPGLAVPVPGRHNRENAVLAIRMACALGCDETAAVAAMRGFGGVERRLQRHGARTFDDYAHNPEKLRAMWETLVEAYPAGVCVVWRPHGYAPLAKMMAALAETFAACVRPCDALLLLPVYDAGGTADRSVSAADLAARLEGVNVVLLDGHDAAFDWVRAHRGDYAAFATCGARDPHLPALARRIAAEVDAE